MPSLQKPDRQLIISYLTLRRAIGFLGMTLPIFSVVGAYVFSGCTVIESSLSQYYYLVVGDFFVGMMCAVAVFLFCYRGYDFWDRTVTNLAGFFAFASALFPTHLSPNIVCAVYKKDRGDLSDLIHLITSAAFLLLLAAMTFFLFTKSNGAMTIQKKARNKIYKTCGVIMISAIVLVGVFRIPAIKPYVQAYKPTFFLESIGLLAFGFSWLIKGEVILKDK